MKKYLFILLLIISLTFFACPNPTPDYDTLFGDSYTGTKGTNWTFMVYLDADNNLESAGVEDLNEMEYGLYLAQQEDSGIMNELNIIVLMDRTDGYDSSNGDWKNTRLYKVLPDSDMSTINSELIFNSDEQNMGDPQLLLDFIGWTKNNFPNTEYFLDLWNHGDGTRSIDLSNTGLSTKSISKAICTDDSNDGDILYIDEVQQAISANFNSSSKLGIIGFDACLMGMVEVAYEFRDLANYMVGSMHNEQGDGWDYEFIFEHFASGSATDHYGTNSYVYAMGNPTSEQLAKLIVYAHENFIESTYSGIGETLSAVDLSQITSLKSAIDSFAVALYNAGAKTNIESDRDTSVHFYSSDDGSISSPFFDLFDFAYRIANNTGGHGYGSTLTNAAFSVISILNNTIVWAYSDTGTYGSYADGTGYYFQSDRGLSIFFSRGNITYDGYSHYAYQWWYTAVDESAYTSSNVYGNIDFCYSDGDGSVENWRELMEVWYDPSNTLTDSSY